MYEKAGTTRTLSLSVNCLDTLSAAFAWKSSPEKMSLPSILAVEREAPRIAAADGGVELAVSCLVIAYVVVRSTSLFSLVRPMVAPQRLVMPYSKAMRTSASVSSP
jgi:hypothetical protein